MNVKARHICVAFLMLLIAGCRPGEQPQWERVGTVTTFSRGSMVVQPFTKRPTAKQLYDRAVKQQRAWRTISTSCVTVKHDYTKGERDRAGVLRPVDNVETFGQELREIRPDKWLLLTNGGRSAMGIRNGRKHLLLWPRENEFSAYTRTAAKEQELRIPCRYLEPARRPYKSLRLMPDTRLKGCDVYVLQIELPEIKLNTGFIPREVVTVYLGKKDLLPRRWDCFDFQPGRGRENHLQFLSVIAFTGYRTDSYISPELFDTQPPKGAKQSRPILVGGPRRK